MPYIKKDDRLKFENILNEFGVLVKDMKAGDLNYIITMMSHRYIGAHGMSYGTINEVMGVLECAKLELYRRKAAPYEDAKADENGDV